MSAWRLGLHKAFRNVLSVSHVVPLDRRSIEKTEWLSNDLEMECWARPSPYLAHLLIFVIHSHFRADNGYLCCTPSLKEVKLDTKNCIWETNFFLQDLISLRRIQNFKEIHLSIFSESIALGVTLVSDAPSNLAVPLPLFR